MTQDTKRLILASVLIFLVVVLQRPFFEAMGYTTNTDLDNPKESLQELKETRTEFDDENSKHIDGFLKRGGGIYKKRYSLTDYKMATALLDNENDEFNFIEKNSGLHYMKKRLNLVAKVYIDNEGKHWVKLGDNSTLLSAYEDARGRRVTGSCMSEEDLKRFCEKKGEEIQVDFDTDAQFRIENYIIEPTYYDGLNKTDGVDEQGVNIICKNIM